MPKSILLLIASWLSIYVLIYEFSKIRKLYISKRDIFLLSAVSWGACLVTITEGLSILTKFSKKPLLVCWILVFLVSLFVSLFLRWKRYGSNLGIKRNLAIPHFLFHVSEEALYHIGNNSRLVIFSGRDLSASCLPIFTQ